ncbi:hypothetical protein LCGC14_2889070, partial [marine sediment metagenome]
LVENSSRDVQIAFANELSMICDEIGINVWEVIKLANRHPRVDILQPGTGVGGHCIAVDPWFIVDSSKGQAKLIKEARLRNMYKTEWVVEKIKNSQVQVSKKNNTLSELKLVKQFVSELDEIHQNIFNRDGSVATSLRSWALKTISEKASEYLIMMNTKIQRIFLSEKTRDISISCYSRNSVLDIDSLSGGEQVVVALSLRLGMAQLLGASNLNFMILDEPTAHLDEERRKSLVNVLAQLSDISHRNSRMPLQFIIITHDSEIFEDSAVEKIYKFESSEQGTKVIPI